MGFGLLSRRVVALVTCALLTLAFADVAAAQRTRAPRTETPVVAAEAVAPAPVPTPAQEAFRRGEAHYRVGQYQDAITQWEQAYALDPRPRIQYNLAQAYERTGRLEDAIAALERYLANGDAADDVYQDANARLAALRQRVAETGIELHGGPTGGAITIDGQAWGVTPRPDRIAVQPGSHAVEIRYPDARVFRANVATPAGQVVPVEITDAALTSTRVVTVERPPSHAMLFAGIGFGAAGLAVLSYGIERQVKVSRCNDADNFCANLSAGETQRSIGLAVGSTLTVAGIALVVVDRLRQRSYDRKHEGAPSLACAPLFPGATCRLRF